MTPRLTPALVLAGGLAPLLAAGVAPARAQMLLPPSNFSTSPFGFRGQAAPGPYTYPAPRPRPVYRYAPARPAYRYAPAPAVTYAPRGYTSAPAPRPTVAPSGPGAFPGATPFQRYRAAVDRGYDPNWATGRGVPLYKPWEY